MEKLPSKVAHNRPPTFFLCTGLAAQTAQKQKSRTTNSPLMQDWVFRLGHEHFLHNKYQTFHIYVLHALIKTLDIFPTYTL